mmetsp:Transcript_125903/g.352521  ORF Transcript_125903/g.352521 Transcript_125903/m.352521 type:complete len:122 (+) Transcript_125903:166-531(+)
MDYASRLSTAPLGAPRPLPSSRAAGAAAALAAPEPAPACEIALSLVLKALVAAAAVAFAIAVLWWTERWCGEPEVLPTSIAATSEKDRAASAEALQVLVIFTLAGAAGKIGSLVDSLLSFS